MERKWLFIFVCLVALILFAGLWLAFDLTMGVALLIFGIALLSFSAEKAVEHSMNLALALGMSPLMIGLVVVSLGTDFPEITNSIISSFLGHGDINVGDSFGSVLVQMTLVLGLVALIGSTYKLSREEITTILPELTVDLTAARKGNYEVAIGDVIGSCIVDAGFSIGIGPLFVGRTAVSGRIAETTGLYVLFCSVLVILVLALREKLDKKAGLLFIILYLFSYTTVYV